MSISYDFSIDPAMQTIRWLTDDPDVTYSFESLIQYFRDQDSQIDLVVEIVCLPPCIPTPETVY